MWPIVVMLILGSGRHARNRTRSLWALLALTVTGALASAVEMPVLFHHGSDATRLYFGTDTHGQSLLIGAALACVVALWRQRGSEYVTSVAVRRTLGLAAIASIAAYAWGFAHIESTQGVAFEGGFTVASIAAALVIADVVLDPYGLVSRALSIAPLRYLVHAWPARHDGRRQGTWPGCWHRACQACPRWRQGGRMRVLARGLRGSPAPVLFWRLRFRAHERRADFHLTDPLLRRPVCAAGQPAHPQVDRRGAVSGSDREFPALTVRSGTQRARDLQIRRYRQVVQDRPSLAVCSGRHSRVVRICRALSGGFAAVLAAVAATGTRPSGLPPRPGR